MRRLAVCLAVAIGALVAAPSALAAGGPLFVAPGGAGAASYDGTVHWVAVPDGPRATILERVDLPTGDVSYWIRVKGAWGTPLVGSGTQTGQGLSHDGKTLVLASTPGPPYQSSSKFLVVNLRRMRVLRTITLAGDFSFDALSPDASRMYLIQYRAGNVNDYIVREYDMRTSRLLPGRIADRSEHEKTMAGSALTRTTSAGGRWVYTLYQKPSGEPFIHALDTVGAAAYCIDLPKNRGLYNIVLSLRNGGRTLAVHWRSGRPWLNVAVGTWRISHPTSGFPSAWVGGGIGAGLLLLAGAGLVLRRRRRQELHEHSRQELGLA
ncbi:MAG TPA: hypothetical protein VKO84_03820 [Gaiellaceae bacterium]|nr:hypothetical protein [Gaiellaceae bacterium]